jgi:hypothetical protein
MKPKHAIKWSQSGPEITQPWKKARNTTNLSEISFISGFSNLRSAERRRRRDGRGENLGGVGSESFIPVISRRCN